MALTRKMLIAMGIEDEKIDQIIEAHSESVNAIKKKLDEAEGLKEDAEKLKKVQKELDDLKAKQQEAEEKNPFKVKYDALKEDFDKYKADQTAKETKAAKITAYKALLKKAGISEKRINAVAKLGDYDKMELDEKGAIKGADELEKGIKEEWSDFITTEGTEGAHTSTPPANNGSKGTGTGRAAAIAKAYHDNLYGAVETSNQNGQNQNGGTK